MDSFFDPDFQEVMLDPDSDTEYDSDGDVRLTQEEVEEAPDGSESDREEEDDIFNLSSEADDVRCGGPFQKGAIFRPAPRKFVEPETFVTADFGNDTDGIFDILRLYLTDEVISNVVDETNEYAKQLKEASPNCMPTWKPVTLEEFWQFIALTLNMGVVKKPAIRDYWSLDPLISTPFFATVMSRNRYMDILRALHFVDNASADKANRYYKLGSFMDSLLKNFQSSVHPGEHLTIDESLLAFQGRLSFKQYNPMKRARFGIKHFVLCDSKTNFVLDILPYQGKSTQIFDKTWIKDLGFGGAAVLTLLQNRLNKGHRLTIDNWFMSPSLADELYRKDTYVLGTVQARRKGMPKMAKGSLSKGEVEIYANRTTLIERWMDRRQVIMLNTFLPHGMEQSTGRNPVNSRMKPKSVLLYNNTMGSLDTVDRTIRTYQSVRKSYKWYKKVVFSLIDIAIFNSNVVYRAKHPEKPKQDYKDVILSLVRQILQKYPVSKPKRGRPAARSTVPDERKSGTHLPEKAIKNGEVFSSDCVYCTMTGGRSSTTIQCQSCKVLLCMKKNKKCFELYHSVEKLPNKKRPRLMQETEDSMMYEESVPYSTSTNSVSLLERPESSVQDLMNIVNATCSPSLSPSLLDPIQLCASSSRLPESLQVISERSSSSLIYKDALWDYEPESRSPSPGMNSQIHHVLNCHKGSVEEAICQGITNVARSSSSYTLSSPHPFLNYGDRTSTGAVLPDTVKMAAGHPGTTPPGTFVHGDTLANFKSDADQHPSAPPPQPSMSLGPSVPTPSIDTSTKPKRSLNPSEKGTRPMTVPKNLSSTFLQYVKANTAKNVESCGLLTGKISGGGLIITDLIIPKQTGTSDTCNMLDEMEIFSLQDQYNLISLGWIHTHPSQTAFLSSIDMHTHYSYQVMLPEAIAIVCAPKQNQTGTFTLTPEGMDEIGSCQKQGFHPHSSNGLFTEAPHCTLDSSIQIKVHDLR